MYHVGKCLVHITIGILDTLLSHGYIISSWRRGRSFYDLAEEHNSKLLINQVEKESFFPTTSRRWRSGVEGAKKFSRQISSDGTLMTRAKRWLHAIPLYLYESSCNYRVDSIHHLDNVSPFGETPILFCISTNLSISNTNFASVFGYF